MEWRPCLFHSETVNKEVSASFPAAVYNGAGKFTLKAEKNQLLSEV